MNPGEVPQGVGVGWGEPELGVRAENEMSSSCFPSLQIGTESDL